MADTHSLRVYLRAADEAKAVGDIRDIYNATNLPEAVKVECKMVLTVNGMPVRSDVLDALVTGYVTSIGPGVLEAAVARANQRAEGAKVEAKAEFDQIFNPIKKD